MKSLLKVRALLCLLSLSGCRTASQSEIRASVSAQKDKAESSGKPVLAMHDVSVLFPDAEDHGEAFFLRPTSPGKGGALIPPTIDLEAFPTSVAFDKSFQLPSSRVVSFRIDPCFPRIEFLETKPELCMHQIRLVLVTPATVNAFHAAYRLSREELENLTREVAALGDHSPEALAAPLSVHPRMAKEGIDGPTAKAMREIILKYAGVQNIVGLAHLNFRSPPRSQWTFQPYTVVNGQLVAQKIPTLGDAHSQQFTVARTGPGGFQVLASPENPDLQAMSVVVNDKKPAAASEPDILKALSHGAKLDNPTVTHFDSSACVSCHFSTPATAEVSKAKKIQLKDDPNLFRSSHNLALTNLEVRRFGEMRNFANSGAVSQRTVNESAVVVDAMIKHGFYK